MKYSKEPGERFPISVSVKEVDSGYWTLYRYDPRLADEGKNPFQLDSKEPNGTIREFIKGEVRYQSLTQSFPEEAEKLHKELAKDVEDRYRKYKAIADNQCI